MRRISKVEIKNKGLKGLRVWDIRTEPDKNGTHFINEYQTKYSAPVNTDFMAFVGNLKKHIKKICKLDPKLDELEIAINHVSISKDESVTINFSVESFGNAWFSIQAPPICCVDDYAGYPDLLADADKVIEETMKYCMGKVQPVEQKQYLISLFDDQQKTGTGGKNKLKQEEIDELDSLTPEEVNERYIAHLEKQGAVLLRTPAEAQGEGFVPDPDEEYDPYEKTSEEEANEEVPEKEEDVMAQAETVRMRKLA